jgi:hypothetical protein
MQTLAKTTAENQSLGDPATEIPRELAEDHVRELRRLSDLAYVFLNATANDRAQAEELFDSMIDLLFEAGALSTWRYRILLAEIRKGL